MLNKRQVRAAFSRRAAAAALSPAALPQQRLRERVASLAQTPALAADVGGNGVFLQQCFPAARVLALDFAAPVLSPAVAGVCADAEALPLADGVVDLLWSNLFLEWVDYRVFFAEAARVLRTDGLLAFAALGPDTLREMRQVFAGEARVHEFTDMHNLGDALLAAGFAEPVLESERLTLLYASAADALTDAHRLGAGNAAAARVPLTSARWRRALADYQHAYCNDAGKIYATYEVIYATAWCAPPRLPNTEAAEAPLRFYRFRGG